jgi:hypothetical protein
VTERLHRTVPGGVIDVTFPGPDMESRVVTTFFDGHSSTFLPKSCDSRTKAAAEAVGYGTRWERFAVDHEMTHHFVAMALQWPCSSIVWQSAHSGRRHPLWRRDREWPYTGWDEEHLVNRLMAYCQRGTPDPEGIILDVWGDRLPEVASHLTAWLKPWLSPPRFPLPLPLRPDLVSHPLAEPEEEVPMGRECRMAWA